MTRYDNRRRRFWAVLAVLAAALIGATTAAGPAGSVDKPYTLAGTTVASDGYTGVPGVEVILHPDSTRALSDQAGDFLLQWSGRKGWVTFSLARQGTQSQDWCIRMVLPPVEEMQGESFLDIGGIRINPNRRTGRPNKPEPPRGAFAPQTAAGPPPEASDREKGEIRYQFKADPFGDIQELGKDGGTDPPAEVMGAIEDWIRNIDWQVQNFGPCEGEAPFMGVITVSWAWGDSLWHYQRVPEQYERRLRPGRPDGSDE